MSLIFNIFVWVKQSGSNSNKFFQACMKHLLWSGSGVCLELGNTHMVINGDVTKKPKFGYTMLESQYSRDKWWVERKSCFIQEASNLGRWWTDVQRPSQKFQTKQKSFKGEEGGYSRSYLLASTQPVCSSSFYEFQGDVLASGLFSAVVRPDLISQDTSGSPVSWGLVSVKSQQSSNEHG